MDNMKIRVTSDIVVEVNDKGETITINVEDQGFIDKFAELIEKLDNVADEVQKAQLNGKKERELLHFTMDKTKDIMAGIDAVFGEGACKKVFGNIIPSPYLISDFFDQITPIATQYMNARQKKIAEKYSNHRKGSNSVR